MADVEQWFFCKLVAFSVVLKLLLIPTYHSTDFEVHRNWLAITNSLPISQWYYEARRSFTTARKRILRVAKNFWWRNVVEYGKHSHDTSQWTLDYPPFFAWFEFLLSQVASLVDPGMTKIDNLEYASMKTVVFQRLSVIAADMMLIYATYQYFRYINKAKSDCKNKSESMVENLNQPQMVCILVILNFGLIIVDHIHFQYNGFLFGMLILSITRMLEDEFLWSALWFSVLLNFKHIYLYIAPAYFVYLLKRYCFKQPDKSAKNNWFGVNIWDLLPLQIMRLGCLVISVFSASFGPFIAMGQLHQVLLRLFPFKRGLCHAYWAPNFWALYNVLDKLLVTFGSKLDIITPVAIRSASMTGGLVGHSQHAILPSISPLATLILTLLGMLPCLINLWIKPCDSKKFLKVLVLCAYGSFIFGWHVHEKAILLVTIPLSLLSFESRIYGRIFLIVSTAGNISLFPLLFQPAETPIKVILMIIHTLFTFWALTNALCSPRTKGMKNLLRWYETIYITGLILLEIYNLFIHTALGLAVKFPFLPLLLTSVYCALGILWSWLLFYYSVLTDDKSIKVVTD